MFFRFHHSCSLHYSETLFLFVGTSFVDGLQAAAAAFNLKRDAFVLWSTFCSFFGFVTSPFVLSCILSQSQSVSLIMDVGLFNL